MEKRKDRIKIFISYHKKSEMIESEIMTPIQVGAKKSSVDLGILRDDEGTNISDKNDKYCELTAQYWAWKNEDADFYGFMHYRRHFIFRDIEYRFEDGRPVSYRGIHKRYREEIGLNDDAIYECVEGVDLILPLAVDTSSWGAVSNEVQFSCLENLHAADFDIVCKTVTELYPDYYDAVWEFRKGHYAYWYNMFIMRKDIFNDYSRWLFHILEESEKKIDFTIYNVQETRTLAFMAERLLSIYLIKLFKDKPELKVKFLKMTFVRNTDFLICGEIKDIEDRRESDSEVDYACWVERAYRELTKLPLPYDLGELFQIKDDKLERLLREKKLIFYGGGDWCRQFLLYFDRLGIEYPLEIWDREADDIQEIRGVRVVKPDFSICSNREDILWIITIRKQSISNEMKQIFSDHGVENVIENRELINWLSYKLWLIVKNKCVSD